MPGSLAARAAEVRDVAMDRRVMLTALGGFGAGAAALAATGSEAVAQAAPQSGLKRILDRGKLIVGTRSTTIGFGFKDAKGELVGFDIDPCQGHRQGFAQR